MEKPFLQVTILPGEGFDWDMLPEPIVLSRIHLTTPNSETKRQTLTVYTLLGTD